MIECFTATTQQGNDRRWTQDRTVSFTSGYAEKMSFDRISKLETLAKRITELTYIWLGNSQNLEYCLLTGQQARGLLPCSRAASEVPSISVFIVTPQTEQRVCLVLSLFYNYVSQNTTQVILWGAGLCICGTCVRVCSVSQHLGRTNLALLSWFLFKLVCRSLWKRVGLGWGLSTAELPFGWIALGKVWWQFNTALGLRPFCPLGCTLAALGHRGNGDLIPGLSVLIVPLELFFMALIFKLMGRLEKFIIWPDQSYCPW